MPTQLSYPEVYLPNEILSISNELPPLPEEPEEPRKPLYPTEPAKNDSNGCLILLLLAVIGITIYAISEEGASFVIVLILVGSLLLGALLLLITKADKRSYEEKLLEYKTQVRNYSKILSQYEADHNAYVKKREKYLEQINSIRSEENIRAYRSKKIQEWKKTLCIDIQDSDDSDQIRTGLSEQFFAEELSNTINDYIKDNLLGYQTNFYLLCAPQLKQKIPVGDTFYYPDLVIENDGLYIDVEIDEPYVGGDGIPIHYIEKEGSFTRSIDEKRNNYMTNHGWIVIRFSEEQIFRNTAKCIDFISNVVHQVDSGKQITIPDDLKYSKWTIDEAARMAYKHYRESYVGSSKLKSVNNCNRDDSILIDDEYYKKGETQWLNESEKNSIVSIIMKSSNNGIPQLVFQMKNGVRLFRAHWDVDFIEGAFIDKDSVKLIEYKKKSNGESAIFAYGKVLPTLSSFPLIEDNEDCQDLPF